MTIALLQYMDWKGSTFLQGSDLMSWVIDLWTWTSEQHGPLLLIIYGYQYIKFNVRQAKGLKSIKWTSLSTVNVQSTSSMTFDFWPHDLKINRDHILFNGHMCTKFDVCPSTSSKGIDLTTLNPMVNVQSLNLGLSKT